MKIIKNKNNSHTCICFKYISFKYLSNFPCYRMKFVVEKKLTHFHARIACASLSTLNYYQQTAIYLSVFYDFQVNYVNV